MEKDNYKEMFISLSEQTQIQAELVENQRMRLEESINYVKKIQNVMLPSFKLMNNCFRENYFVLDKPKNLVSGNFYWFANIKNRIVIAVAECSKNGLPGALLGVLGITFLNDIVIKDKVIDPDQILNRLRRHFITSLHQKSSFNEIKDGMDVAVLSVDIDNRILEYSGAKLPLVIIRKKTIIETKGDKMSITIPENAEEFSSDHLNEVYFGQKKDWLDKIEKAHNFTKKSLEIENGDLFYLFSNGYANQIGGEYGKKFQYDMFVELLKVISSYPLKKQEKVLNEQFEKWKGGHQQSNDLIVLGLKFCF